MTRLTEFDIKTVGAHLTKSKESRRCGNKVKYKTKYDADQALTILKPDRTRLNAYRCGLCPGWHLGNRNHFRRIVELHFICPYCAQELRYKRVYPHLAKCIGFVSGVDRDTELNLISQVMEPQNGA